MIFYRKNDRFTEKFVVLLIIYRYYINPVSLQKYYNLVTANIACIYILQMYIQGLRIRVEIDRIQIQYFIKGFWIDI